MKDDFHALDESRHMLPWVGLDEDDPYGELREHFEEALVSQDAGSVLEWVRLVGEPKWLTAGKKTDDGSMVLQRAGLAVAFELSVVAGDLRRWPLAGVATFLGVRLGTPEARFQFLFDVNADLEEMSATEFFACRLATLDEG